MSRIKLIIFSTLAFALISTPPPAYCIDVLSQVHPYIIVKGEYNDNLNLTRENKINDFFTTITPGIKFSNITPKSSVTLDANVGTVLYNNHSNLNYISSSVNLDSKYLTSSHFNFYIKDYFIRSDDPREREFFTTTQENKFMLATETQRSVYWRNVVSPTVEYQFGPESRIAVTYRNNIYRTAAVDSENSLENYVNPSITFWLNKQIGFSIAYEYTNGHFDISPDFNSHKVMASYMMRLTPKATASLNGAYTKQEFSVEHKDYAIYESWLGISYLFSSSLSASAQVGYYWQNREIGQNNNGVTFKADIVQKDARTTYNLSVQGGYIQDYFTSLNLGFVKYYRATGSITHFLEKRLSIGCLGSVERAESELDRRDTIWGAGVNVSYLPFQWLRFSLEYTYNQHNTNYLVEAANEYVLNRVMLTVTATY